ncbi:hypothetical protein F0U44_09910 [Nocardioides humilatus]|uniref:CARDB domain-containing protein n=1 Tax=Nocardioides humilatus TaxID=2607660 RepID=A0A5B1LEC2_9ACTN|nr:hypothetical protein [Nocardioides humilatus]KAA1418796.1 hypothetical protein F0U44_09910 [Nocardioides humilatus]
MPTSHRRLAPALAFLLSCCLVGLPASPAAAEAAETAQLIVKAKGSGYSGLRDFAGIVGVAVKRGGTATYQARVVNYGDTAAHFVLRLEAAFMPATRTVKADNHDITATIQSVAGYTTPLIEPGDYLQLSLKVTPDEDEPPTPVDAAATQIGVLSTEDVLVSSGAFYTMIKAPAHGTSGAEVYARQGSQPYVGGEEPGYFTTSPVVRPGSTTTIKVKFQNDGVDAHQIRGGLNFYNPDCFDITAKQGRTDITADLEASTYVTPQLAPGKSVAIKLRVHWAGEYCGYPFGSGGLAAFDADDNAAGFVQFAVLLPAVVG